MPRMIVVREERCLGCKSCMIACGMAHTEASSLEEAMRLESRPQSRMHLEPVGRYGTPINCQQCEDAPCVSVCPTGAMARRDPGGPVLLDTERCIGCKFCIVVCPFGVIELSRDGKAAVKCDLCIARTEAGQLPACVAACPTKALQYVELEDWSSRRRREAAAKMRQSAETPAAAAAPAGQRR